jgi:IclR family acetate operon transcriptional repressor
MVQVIDRAFDILELLATAGDAVSLSHIHERVNLAPSTTHRILTMLVTRGYAVQNSTTRLYSPGPKLLEMAARASTNAVFNVQIVARAFLRDLVTATGETTNLAFPQREGVVYIDQVESGHVVRMFTEVGHQAPFYCTAVGKAMLSAFPAQQGEAYLAAVDLRPFTANTIIDRRQLAAEIARARLRGYAVDDEEREPGVRCVAAPILDHRGRCVAGISISGPASRVRADRLDALGGQVRDAARRCSLQLGARTAPEGLPAGHRAAEELDHTERQPAVIP